MIKHREQDVVLLDGGMGRELKRMGAPFRQPEWSALALMEQPEAVSRAHRAFMIAGADVITTNNYAVVPFHIGRERFRSVGRELITLAGRLAREAVEAESANVRVAGSIPPLFGSYRPDLFEPENAAAGLSTIVDSLDPWVDIWLAETLGSLAEYRSVVAALDRSDKPLWVSFSVSDEPEDKGQFLRSGEPLRAVLREVSQGPAKALLFNCSQPENISGAMSMVSATDDFRRNDICIGAYANTFTPRPKDAEANSDDAELRSEIDPTYYLDFVNSWLDSGATIVGGCCGIGPEHIRSMYRSLRP